MQNEYVFHCLFFSAPPKSVSFSLEKSSSWGTRLNCVADKVKPRDEAKIVLMNDTHKLSSREYKYVNQVTQTTNYGYPIFTRHDNLQNWLYCIVTWRGQEFIAHLQEPLEVPCKYNIFFVILLPIRQLNGIDRFSF